VAARVSTVCAVNEFSVTAPKTLFFGTRWDAPMLDNAEPVPTPIGWACLHCGEPVVDGDQGVMRACLTSLDDGTAAGRWRPAHRECDLRAMVGSVAHLEGRCSCHDGQTDETEGSSWRQQGRDVMAWLNEHAI
jgi:hypothetical protein